MTTLFANDIVTINDFILNLTTDESLDSYILFWRGRAGSVSRINHVNIEESMPLIKTAVDQFSITVHTSTEEQEYNVFGNKINNPMVNTYRPSK